MQLIRKWEDKIYRAINYLYVLDGGTKLVHTLNPHSLDATIYVTVKAGAFYEKTLGVPMGTAHFIEHMIAGNPNKLHKTPEQIFSYEYGSKKRPHMVTNASTDTRFLEFYGYTNEKGANRLAKKLLSIVDYPLSNFPRFIEKERKVILAERQMSPKTEKYEEYQFEVFMLNDQMRGKAVLVSGEIEDIKKVKVSHLKHFYNKLFTHDNAIISVQSPEKITGEFKKTLEKIGSLFSKRKTQAPKFPREKFANLYKYKHFYNDQSHGVEVSLAYFQETPSRINYRERILTAILLDLLCEVAFRRLREKLGLVYYFIDRKGDQLLKNYDINALQFGCDYNNLKRVLKETNKIFYKYAQKFLQTKKGAKWFEDKISRHLFPTTLSYNRAYSPHKAAAILMGQEIALPEKSIAVAEKLKPQDLIKHLRNYFQKTPPHVWISSSKKDSEIYKVYEKSEIHKRWSSRVSKKLKK